MTAVEGVGAPVVAVRRARPGEGRYVPARPDPSARLRLFCFHHAGGGASTFADWQDALGPGVCVVPVQLPGREARVGEATVREMPRLLAELHDEIGPWLDEPYACYGHSMGAYVASALAHHRRALGRSLPSTLLVGAAKAPHLPLVLGSAPGMTDEQLGRVLVRMGGMSETLLRYPDWLAAATGLVRDDLQVCATNPHRSAEPLPVPVHAFAGTADPVVRIDEVAAWEQHTEAGSTLRLVSGGHFFLRDSRTDFLRTVREVLAAALPPGVPVPPEAHPDPFRQMRV